MADQMQLLPPYFKIDELANRWGVSSGAVMSYGIDGQLRFGLFVTGLLRVEVGEYVQQPSFPFVVESSGCWSGFIPIKTEMVAALYLNGETDRWQIPDTDCGKSVRVISYIPNDECNTAPTLMIAGDEVERFERETMGGCATTGSSPCQSEDWEQGIRNAAWMAAVAIAKRNDKLTPNGLEKQMIDNGDVELIEGAYHLKNPACGLTDRQTSAKPKTIAGWVTELKKLV